MTESDYIEKIKALWRVDDTSTSESLRLIEQSLRAYPTSTRLHCLRGDLIQLSNDKSYPLEAALASYEKAIAIDPDCAEAHESVGCYCDTVINDLHRAEAAFHQAVRLGGGRESYVGLARVLAELGHSSQEIFEFLDTCPYSDTTEVRKVRSEIERGCWSPEAK